MTPLVVVAHLRGAVAMPNGPIALDALIGAAVAKERGLPPPSFNAEMVPIHDLIGDVIARSPCERFYLASCCVGTVEQHEHRWINRRFPIDVAQQIAEPTFNRIDIASGAQKSYRLPLDTIHFEGDRLTWFAIGDVDRVRDLLVRCIGSIGKRIGVGHGAVGRWEVEPCNPLDIRVFGAGPGYDFPVLRDGYPTRPLPPDYPGLAPDAERARRTLAPPYWRRDQEELAAVPRWES